MSKRVKNWLLGVLVTAAFILGVPAIEYVFAGIGGSAAKVETVSGSEHASHSLGGATSCPAPAESTPQEEHNH